MKRARKWFAELSHGSIRSSRPRCAPRRLLMPERLESRNAPGAMLPMLPLFASQGEEGEVNGSSLYSSDPSGEVQPSYRIDAIAPSPELHLSIQSFIDALRAEEAANQENQSKRQITQQLTEYSTSADAAARGTAFELFNNQVTSTFVPIIFAVPEVPPPVIHPVEPGPEPETPEVPTASAPEAIAEPTPTGSESNSQAPVASTAPSVSAPLAPAIPVETAYVDRETASEVVAPPVEEPAPIDSATNDPPAAEIPPPIIQPVITDPESEYNQPSPEPVESEHAVEAAPPAEEPAETPPPMIQPVITDPDSEYNQPSPEPVEPEPQVVSEPVVDSAPPLVPEPEPIVETVTVTEVPIETAPPVESEPQAEVQSETEPTTPVLPLPPVESTITESVPPVIEQAPVVEPAPAVQAVVVPSIVNNSTVSALSTPDQLSASEVDLLLDRATRVTARNDAIIAIVDRNGRILGVHVEQGVLDAIPDMATLVFAIDGAIAKARTAAFFSNNEAALTSRTVRFISQTTITQREVEANPNSTDESIRGPGFVAPIGVGGHFPPDVPYTPPVDLFAIEHTNRDSLVHPGANGVKQTVGVDNDGNPLTSSGDDIFLGKRFGANFVPGQEIYAPESYGLVSDLLSNAQSRGIATLPGGVPLYKVDPADGISKLVGGVGVFFPGDDGYATHEQGFVAGVGQTTQQRLNAPLVIEAEYTAAVIASNTAVVAGLAPLAGIGLPNLPGGGRIDLAGITLESFGPHPYKLNTFLAMGQSKFSTGADTGTRMPVTKGGDLTLAGEQVPTGWLVNPTAGTNLTALEVEAMIERGVEEAERVRAAIRLPLGTRTSMVLAVTDTDGTVLGLFRMDDATVFSIDVAVAKARNVAYYADASEIKDVDRVDADGDGTPDVDAGVAFTNRTFRYLAEPRFPAGIEGTVASPFSTLLTPGVNPRTAENMPGVTPDASDFTTVLGYDAFHPGTNFREDVPSTGYQNGIVFFPGSTALYKNGVLVGGLGVSGDGVDQDDVVTFFGAGEFLPGKDSPITRADEVFVRDVRLPYQKFLRNPHG